jgi:hypothetical protein
MSKRKRVSAERAPNRASKVQGSSSEAAEPSNKTLKAQIAGQ